MKKIHLHVIPWGLLIVTLLSLLPLVAFLHSGLPITHDGVDHVARIANFYKSLSEGNLIPRWAGNLNWGYGHPILMFLYPVSSYLGSLFHFIGFDLIDSVKLVFGMGFIASGITMYLWARNQFNEYAGIAAAALYLFAPYRFVDMYVRGAIGEHMALVFPPLVLYFLLKYFQNITAKNNYKNIVGISASIFLLLLAHNAISIMFLPFFILYTLYLAYTTKQYNKLFLSFVAFFWGFLLSSFFIIPAFFEGKFTLRDIVTGNEYATRFVKPLSLIYGPWSYGITGEFSVQIGLANLIGTILFPFIALKDKKSRVLLCLVFLCLAFSVFLMLPQSNSLYMILTTLKKFQFPWRFLNVTIFSASILGASAVGFIKNKKKVKIILTLLVLFLLVTTFTYWRAKGYIHQPDYFYNGIYHGTTDTGESAPIWSVRFMEKEPKAHLELIDGQAIFTEQSRVSTRHKYFVTVNSNTARIRENTLYFPNWTVYANNKKVDIQFQDPTERGLITFVLPKGEYSLDVVFKDTKLRIFSDIMSFFAFLVILFGFIINRKRYEK